MEEIGFTIGIPAYERPRYTREALESCLLQNYSNFEIVIGDDSDTDRIECLVKTLKSPLIKYFRHSSRLGLPTNLNFILNESVHPWMIVLANDDLLEPDYLAKVNAVIQNENNPALIRCQYQMIGENGDFIRKDRMQPYRMSSCEFLSQAFMRYDQVPWMSISAVAFPASRMKALGGFKDFHRGHHMDRAAWSQIAVTGDCFFIQEPLAKIRHHSGEITTTMDPDFEKALISTFRMSGMMECILDQLNLKALNENDRVHLKMARLRLGEYVARQINRSLDQGIMGRMQDGKIQSAEDLAGIQNKVEQIQPRAFTSYYFYLLLLMMPKFLRYQMLSLFKTYKFRRWHQ